ncbi:hypothetical protein HY627_01845 [Candidatus Uhrbacteria bacterium]|nr:hypothetical protein [Candidatus Uhrbacteria bacterium]
MRFSLNRFFLKFAAFMMVWSAFFGSTAANAAEITYIRDTLQKMQVSTSTGHTITFYMPTALAASEAIFIRFSTTTAGQPNFAFVAGISTTNSIDVATGAPASANDAYKCSDSTQGGSVTYGTPVAPTSTVATGSEWATGSSSLMSGIQISTTLRTSWVSAPAATCFRFRLGTTTNLLTNPSWSSTASNQYIISISDTSDSGQGAVAIVTNDYFTSTATSTPSMTFEVGTMTTACDATTAASSFGTGGLTFYDLRADYVEPTSNMVCTRVSTNAAQGAIVQIKSLYGRMTSTKNGVTFPASAQTAASSTINLVGGINTSTEAYGICASATGVGDATPASAVVRAINGLTSTCATTQNQVLTGAQVMRLLGTTFDTLWTTSGATYRAYANMYLKAAVAVNTPVTNSYTDTLTFIAFATF